MLEKNISLRSKSGKPLERYFPDIVGVLQNLETKILVTDGELLITGEEAYSFANLQMRLHPAASRVNAGG